MVTRDPVRVMKSQIPKTSIVSPFLIYRNIRLFKGAVKGLAWNFCNRNVTEFGARATPEHREKRHPSGSGHCSVRRGWGLDSVDLILTILAQPGYGIFLFGKFVSEGRGVTTTPNRGRNTGVRLNCRSPAKQGFEEASDLRGLVRRRCHFFYLL